MAKPLDYNYAKDRDFAQIVSTDILQAFAQAKSSRQEREERWQEAYRAWSIDTHGADKSYHGRANLFLPQIRKEVETMSRRLVKALFPEDYLKGEPSRFENEDLALVNTQLVRHYFDNVMNLKQACLPWLKQAVLYGTSPIRSFWKKEVNEMFFKKRYFDDNGAGVIEPRTKIVQEEVVLYNAPCVRVEDMFNTYVYPSNVSKASDAKCIFSLSKITLSELKEKEERGEVAHFEEFASQAEKITQIDEEAQERGSLFSESGTMYAIGEDGYFDILEVFTKIVLPGEKVPVPVVIEILNNGVAHRIQRNGYWHQQAPFDFARFIIPPGNEFYARGLPEAVTSLQHQINDTLNQGMDSATLALNNITIINPAFAPNADSFEFEPGARWWADPNAVKQFSVPDLSDISIKNAGLLRGVITEMSDNSPQLPDPIAGKARSTGQAQLAINEWQTDLFMFVDLVGVEALGPFTKKVHLLLQQNLSDDDVIRVSGKYAGTWINRVVTPEQIVGNYDFTWLASMSVENQSVKTQQLLNLLKILPSLPPEAQSQIKMKWDNFFIKILRDGYQIKDVHNIIETEALNSSTPPGIENRICELGGEIAVHKSDDDSIHIQEHTRFLNGLPKKSVYERAKIANHIREHEQQAEAKKMEIKQLEMMMAQAGGQQEGPPGPAPEISETTDPADLERGLGGY